MFLVIQIATSPVGIIDAFQGDSSTPTVRSPVRVSSVAMVGGIRCPNAAHYQEINSDEIYRVTSHMGT